MKRIERLHAITEELRRSAPRPVAAQRLADRFGVSRRTIERDVDALRLAGVPTYGQVGRGGGTVLVSSGPSRPVTLTVAEAVSLVAAVHLAAHSPYSTSGNSAIAKILDAVSDGDRVLVEQLRSRFRLAAATREVSARVTSVVEDSVRTQTVVNLSYVDRNGARTLRSVDPSGFYVDGDTWSLVAWCHRRQAGRLFRLDRISKADPTNRPCVQRNLNEVLGWVPRPGDPL